MCSTVARSAAGALRPGRPHLTVGGAQGPAARPGCTGTGRFMLNGFGRVGTATKLSARRTPGRGTRSPCLVRVQGNRPQDKPKQNQEDSWDPLLVAGDVIMVAATELASGRIPVNSHGFICMILCTVWTTVAFLRGNYTHSNLDLDAFADWFVIAPMLASMQSAMYTWVLFAPGAAAILSYLAATGVLDPAVMDNSSPDGAPVAEVLGASILTLASWRGIYAGLFL